MVQTVTGNLVEVSSAVRIEIFNGVNYNANKDFVIDLDNIWQWLGFQQKNNAKQLLERKFIKDIDYKCLILNNQEQKVGRGGHNKETILLTIKAFKQFCLKSGTKKANEIHDYYIKYVLVIKPLPRHWIKI